MAPATSIRSHPTQPTASTSAVKLDATVASPRKGSAKDVAESPSGKRPIELPRQRSRGQIARRQSITRGTDRLSRAARLAATTSSDSSPAELATLQTSSVDDEAEKRNDKSRYSIFGLGSSTSASQSSTSVKTRSSKSSKERNDMQQHRRRRSDHRAQSKGVLHRTEQPWLGGLYFTDLVFIAFTYAINLLRTCGLAELFDVAFKGLVYALTSLPVDIYRRWTLSAPPDSSHYRNRHAAARIRRRKLRRGKSSRSRQADIDTVLQPSGSESDNAETTLQPDIFASSSSKATGEVVEQLSPFHHLVILLSRFSCGHFPHLLPRILFAEETIGPFVYWRTGGGSNAMVREFSDLSQRSTPVIQDDLRGPVQPPSSKVVEPGFRAYVLSKDATVPTEVQRVSLASQKATTLLYLHGGGFSLGSVAFYAEALLRVRAKIALLEAEARLSQGKSQGASMAEARCIAVEYDLSPSARFPMPLLQCLRCYAYLVEVERIDPESICVAGDSAGGNLAMTMLLCLSGQFHNDAAVPELHERDWSKLPMPGKAVLISPWVDLRPSTAHAFASLRGEHGRKTEQKHQDASVAGKTGTGFHHDEAAASAATEKSWTEAVARYDWDFVASEALLHFAQVYAGVLPTPRRVYGPLGWIAHICGVLAMGDTPPHSDAEGDSPAKEATGPWPYQLYGLKGMLDPTRALAALSRPTRRLAKATHSFLTDPMLSRILSSPLSSNEQGIMSEHTSALAGLEPLFTADDRRTCLVGDMSQLYEPVDAPFASTAAEKIGAHETPLSTRQRGLNLLETHPLLNPALGDWSKIDLKHGCLVTWGERERMAADIEAWIESVPERNGQASLRRGDTPVQDQSLPRKIRSSAQRGEISEQTSTSSSVDADWMYVAVEKGPGGVHAWPFVSMYLAGSERERERGLDLLAQFVARLPQDDDGKRDADKGLGISHEALAMPFTLDTARTGPESPDNDDAASVGSMPSDVDLHGMVDDEDDGDGDGPQHVYWTGMSSPTIDVAEAVRRAQRLEQGSTGSSASNSPVSERMPSTPPRPSSALSSSSTSSRQKLQDSPVIQLSLPPKQQKPKRVAATKPKQGKTAAPQRTVSNAVAQASAQIAPRSVRAKPVQAPKTSPKAKERGRSRSPRRSPAFTSASASQPASPSQTDSTRVALSRTTSSSSTTSSSASSRVDAPRPIAAEKKEKRTPTTPSAQVASADTRNAPQPEPYQQEVVTPPGPAKSATRHTGDAVEDVRPHGLGDITHASPEGASATIKPAAEATGVLPDNALGPRQQTGQGGDVDSTDSTDDLEDPDASQSFGLSQYAVRRPEPEGLSDIAEEGSVLSASYTSGAELRSRSVSPTGHFGDMHRGQQGATSLLGAATQVMGSSATESGSTPTSSYASAAAKAVPQPAKQWRYLRDEIPTTSRRREALSYEDTSSSDMLDADDDDGLDRSLASSPPAGVQPGPSLRTVSSTSSLKSQRRDSTKPGMDPDASTNSTSSDADTRKKPKGDVWW